jgi:hypothetical protein
MLHGHESGDFDRIHEEIIVLTFTLPRSWSVMLFEYRWFLKDTQINRNGKAIPNLDKSESPKDAARVPYSGHLTFTGSAGPAHFSDSAFHL